MDWSNDVKLPSQNTDSSRGILVFRGTLSDTASSRVNRGTPFLTDTHHYAQRGTETLTLGRPLRLSKCIRGTQGPLEDFLAFARKRVDSIRLWEGRELGGPILGHLNTQAHQGTSVRGEGMRKAPSTVRTHRPYPPGPADRDRTDSPALPGTHPEDSMGVLRGASKLPVRGAAQGKGLPGGSPKHRQEPAGARGCPWGPRECGGENQTWCGCRIGGVRGDGVKRH